MRASIRPIAVALSLLLWSAACSPERKPPPAPRLTPPAPAPAKLVSSVDLPPRQQVKGDGITITEYVDGRVNVKTTMAWKEAFDTTYDSCAYYRDALPVLRRQLVPERAKVLDGMCVLSPPEPEAAAKPEAKAAVAVKIARRKGSVKTNKE